MVVNLNKKYVSKELLFEHISDLQIYRAYIDFDIKFGTVFSSPLREIDNKPSFGFFEGEGGEICFKDFVLGTGDCIKFVQMKFGLNYFEALSKIALDFNLEDEFKITNTFKTNINSNYQNFKDREAIIREINSNNLGKTARTWALHDLAFWNKFGITKTTLEKYNVEPVSYLHVGVNKKIIPADKYAYSFREAKEGSFTYKIYQPYNINYKWLNNHNNSVWQGWSQLPLTGNEIIITKSLKDVMSIHDVLGIPAVALQSESVIPKEKIIDELKSRFKYVYILYDNDYDKEENWGQIFSNKLTKEFGFYEMFIHEKYKSKDFSDLVKNHGSKIATDYINTLMDLPF
jgi:hypothetical protein